MAFPAYESTPDNPDGSEGLPSRQALTDRRDTGERQTFPRRLPSLDPKNVRR
jgi:hypothetical protein